MSSPGRRDGDFYVTPAWMTDHLLDRLPLRLHPSPADYGPPYIMEPCVGEGHIVNAIWRREPDATCLTNDIDERHPAETHEDARDPAYWNARHPDWVITNPPFSDAFPIIKNAVETARVGVAALLRVTWLEPTKERGLWLAANPPKWQLTMERYSFDGSGGGDSATSAWYVWSPYLQPRIEIIVGRGRQEGLL